MACAHLRVLAEVAQLIRRNLGLVISGDMTFKLFTGPSFDLRTRAVTPGVRPNEFLITRDYISLVDLEMELLIAVRSGRSL